MGQSMVGRLAIKAKQIKPGDAFAAVVPAGGLVEIVDLEGSQVAELVAFDRADPSEHLSLGVTRQQGKSIMLSLGMSLYSSRGRTMLELIEDTVGRHDILWAAPTAVVEPVPAPEPATDQPVAPENGADDPVSGETTLDDGRDRAIADQAQGGPSATVDETDPDAAGNAPTDGSEVRPSPEAPADEPPVTDVEPKQDRLAGFPEALAPFGLARVDAPDPVNFFMQLAVMQRGDLELRAPTSERGDRVVLRAVSDLIVAVRCSAAEDETNAERPSDILVRVYR